MYPETVPAPARKTAPEPIEEILTKATGQASFATTDGHTGEFTLPLMQETAKLILEHADKLDAVLAEKGEQLDRAKITEVMNASVEAVESAKQFASDVVEGETLNLVSQETFDDFKIQINDSFEEIANILLDLGSRFDLLDERIAQFNRRGGHKI